VKQRAKEAELDSEEVFKRLSVFRMTTSVVNQASGSSWDDLSETVNNWRSDEWRSLIDKMRGDDTIDKTKQLKNMVRIGIPNDVRGYAWEVLSQAHRREPVEIFAGRRQEWIRKILGQKLRSVDLN